MSDVQNFGFGKFVPGFDFLQSLAKGASQAMPQIPGLSSWIAPTLNVEELDKRLSELRTVLFWLEQNGKALNATIQALEVQKMTLATLKGMDVTMADLAQALKIQPQAQPQPPHGAAAPASAAPEAAAAGAPVVDPLQWWSSLTQQFQQIAATAMQEAAQSNPVEAAREVATGMAEAAAAAERPARKRAPRKTTATRKPTTGGGRQGGR